MIDSTFLRLERVEVDGLFEIYDHRITLNLTDRVTLLHGPNGVGKTVVLRMVSALLKGQLEFFRTVPFARFMLYFDNGSELTVTTRRDNLDDELPYTLSLRHGDRTQYAYTDLSSTTAAAIASRIQYLRPHDTEIDIWIDIRDGELLSATDIVERFGDESRSRPDQPHSDIPWFAEFLKRVNAHLIEAQRLVRLDWEAESRFAYRRRRHRPSSSAVIACSREFSSRISGTMAQYGRQSQLLDQSFPQRLLSAQERLTEAELEEKMSALDRKTSAFKSIGILEDAPAYTFRVAKLRDIDTTKALVMTLYVRDTEKKLGALEELANKTQRLLDNVNKKYRHKKIVVDSEDGLVAKSDAGHKLPLDVLSSGEQHELVLHYDLLFRVPRNTIVLIDEPELSLHVAWQKCFLPDLLGIVELSDFDALVATHSPYIVGEREELMVGLGDGIVE